MPISGSSFGVRRRAFLGGRSIEEAVVGREDRIPLVPPTLEPFRQLLTEHRWLGGDQPNYADYRALSVFLWLASIASTPATFPAITRKRAPASLEASRATSSASRGW